jgi:hypothetical protein
MLQQDQEAVDNTLCIKNTAPPWRCDLTRAMASSFLRFLDHTQVRNAVGETPLDEWSALPDNSQHSQQTNIHAPAGFEPTISVGERPRTYTLDRPATGTGANTYFKAI